MFHMLALLKKSNFRQPHYTCPNLKCNHGNIYFFKNVNQLNMPKSTLKVIIVLKNDCFDLFCTFWEICQFWLLSWSAAVANFNTKIEQANFSAILCSIGIGFIH